MVLAKAPKPPLGSHMPINPIQRTHTQIHTRIVEITRTAGAGAGADAAAALFPYASMPMPYPDHHGIASVTHQVYPHTNRLHLHAHTNYPTCLHALLFLSHSRPRSLCMCCPFPSLSHPPSAAVRRRSSASFGPLLLACIASLRTSSWRASPAGHRRCAHCKTAVASGSDSAANGAGAARCPIHVPCLPLAGTWVHATTASIRTPPSRSYCFAFSPFRRPPESSPYEQPAQVPAGYSYTHGPSAWMGLGRTLKSLSHRPFAVGPSAPGPLSPAEMRAALSKVAAQHAQH